MSKIIADWRLETIVFVYLHKSFISWDALLPPPLSKLFIRLFPILVLWWNYFSNWKRFFASLYIYIYIYYIYIYIHIWLFIVRILNIFRNLASRNHSSVRAIINSFAFSFPFLVNLFFFCILIQCTLAYKIIIIIVLKVIVLLLYNPR